MTMITIFVMVDVPEKGFRTGKLDSLQSTWTCVSVFRAFPKNGKTGKVTDCCVVGGGDGLTAF